jgi:hypothetical protein
MTTTEGRPGQSSLAHARTHDIKPETVRERVAYIVELMSELEWDGRASIHALSEAWELSESAIKQYSAEASRLVTGDEETARRDITAGCRRLFKRAVAGDDAKAARAVGELWAQVSGAKAPEKHQHGLLDEISPNKAREVMAGLFGAVTPDAQPALEPHKSEPPEESTGE